jgi:hypothetical protein
MRFTDEHYADLEDFVGEEIPLLHIVKDRTVEMNLIEAGLTAVKRVVGPSVFNISVEEWLSHRAVTFGTLVHVPSSWSPLDRACGLIHEAQHVYQFLDRQPQSDLPANLGMAWLYLTWGEGRMRFEVEAYRAGQLEFLNELTGVLPSLEDLEEPLEGTSYLLSTESKKTAHTLLGAAGETVASGVFPSTAAGRLGRKWVQTRYPEIYQRVTG